MLPCGKCGREILIRYRGGRRIPFHVDGSCSGYGGIAAVATSAFTNTVSYVDPNAYCPVCGKQVFYYQSPYGGRVFFDDLGWPWPKHPCTDNPRSQHGYVQLRASNGHKPFRNDAGEQLDLYELLSLTEKRNIIDMRFGRLNENRSFSVSIPLGHLRECDITIDDLKNAPSFVVRTYETYRIVEFISGRKQRIDALRLARSRKAPA